MRKNIYTVVILSIALILAQSALADVKVKTRQTASGQSYENTTYIKGKRSRTESMNGAMINLTQCDLRRGVQINPAARTYMINEFVQATQGATTTRDQRSTSGVVQTGGKITTTITTKDTGERKQMFGYTARHLIITMETVSSPDACSPNNTKMQTDGWYIDAEFALDCDYGFQSAAGNPYATKGCQDKYEMKQISTAKRGYPVYERMSMFDPSGKEMYSMTNEVVEVSKATLEAALFEVPQDYRQVSDASQLYAAARYNDLSTSNGTSRTGTSASGPNQSESPLAQGIRNAAQKTASEAPTLAPKKQGTIRIGLSGVKTGAVGDGIAAADLATAVRNSLSQHLKTSNIETVTLNATSPTAVDAEANQKDCDYVIYANVSHKKGGGGFGGFGSALGSAIGRVGIGQTGSTAGNIAGQIATQTIVSATSLSANVKSKDELTLDIRLQRPSGDAVVAKQFKTKAKSNGDDIISSTVEQAVQAIVSAIVK